MRQIVILAVAAIFNQDKMLVGKRSNREQFLANYWTGIGGKLEDSDASIEAAVKREAKEETGLDVKVIRPLLINEFTREDKPGVLGVNLTYLCTTDDPTKLTLNEEHSELKWVTKEELETLKPQTEFGKKNLTDVFGQYFETKKV
jgi:8-oxo-dGTP pyrophosphatase MutT (NUDIX family)